MFLEKINKQLKKVTMKNLLTIIIALFTLTVTAQELDKNEVDEFTGKVKKITMEYETAKGATTTAMRFANIGGTFGIYAYAYESLGCSGAVGNYIIFKFTDGTILRLEDTAKVDCKDYCNSIFVFDPEVLEGKTIEKIRFRQSNGYDDAVWICEFNIQDFINVIR
jgi:hypothetical protein